MAHVIDPEILALHMLAYEEGEIFMHVATLSKIGLDYYSIGN